VPLDVILSTFLTFNLCSHFQSVEQATRIRNESVTNLSVKDKISLISWVLWRILCYSCFRRPTIRLVNLRNNILKVYDIDYLALVLIKKKKLIIWLWLPSKYIWNVPPNFFHSFFLPPLSLSLSLSKMGMDSLALFVFLLFSIFSTCVIRI